MVGSADVWVGDLFGVERLRGEVGAYDGKDCNRRTWRVANTAPREIKGNTIEPRRPPTIGVAGAIATYLALYTLDLAPGPARIFNAPHCAADHGGALSRSLDFRQGGSSSRFGYHSPTLLSLGLGQSDGQSRL